MKIVRLLLALICAMSFAGSLCTCSIWPLNNPLDASWKSSHDANVTVLAGSKGVSGQTDGTGTAALFEYPRAICSDGANLYVLDGYSGVIRKIVIATGAVTTISIGFSYSEGICTDGANLYLSAWGNNCIYKVPIAAGAPSVFAGDPLFTPGLSDGTGTFAKFNRPSGICTDGTTIYVADFANNNIRQIGIASAVVTTIAGSTTGQSGSSDGTGTAAFFKSPSTLCLVGNRLLVNEQYSYKIRLIQLSTAEITSQSISGNGNSINGVGAYDGSQFLYAIGDGGISKIDTSSWIGLCAKVTGYYPDSLCMSGTDLFIADAVSKVILKLVDIK